MRNSYVVFICIKVDCSWLEQRLEVSILHTTEFISCHEVKDQVCCHRLQILRLDCTKEPLRIMNVVKSFDLALKAQFIEEGIYFPLFTPFFANDKHELLLLYECKLVCHS